MRTWTATAAVHEGPSFDPKIPRVLIDQRGLVVLAETTLAVGEPPDVPFSQGAIDYLAPSAGNVTGIESSARLEAFVRQLLEDGPWEALANGHGSNGNAAAIVLALGRETWSLASVGDARAYLLREQDVELVVEDHSLFTRLLVEGKLAETDFFSFVHHTVVLEMLGVNSVLTVRSASGPIVAGESLVLCTQHLWQGRGPLEVRERLLTIRNELNADSALHALHVDGREGAVVVVNFR